MVEPTSRNEADEALRKADENLMRVQQKRQEARGIVGSLTRMLEENHFSLRLAEALGMKDDRR